MRQGARLADVVAVTGWAVIAACPCYVATIIYGFHAGYALPTVAIFDLAGFDLARLEQFFPIAVIAIALVGAGVSWLAFFGILPAAPVQNAEAALERQWRWWALPVIVCLFTFGLSAGGWSGHIRRPDLNYASWAGLIPYSDASAYFTDTPRQAFFGQWDVIGSRRPLAQAFRDVVGFASQYSYSASLLIQLAILSVAASAATRSVARWRGIWVGVAFFGMIYALARPVLFTTLTEPLGLICSLVSLVLFIEALRNESLPHALLGLAALTAALLMRMGSLFTIPMLILWIAYAFGATNRKRWRAGAAACGAVAIVFLFSAALGSLYGFKGTISGANFAWTICGMSLGSNWAGCQSHYASQLALLADETAQARFLVGQSLENIAQHPGTFAHSLLENVVAFMTGMPRLLVRYYGGGVGFVAGAAALAILGLVPGLVLVWRAARRGERVFWITMLVSIVLSAAVVFSDDGWRVLYVTHVYMACVASFAFATPGVAMRERLTLAAGRPSRLGQVGLAAMVTVAALFVLVPWLARVEAARELAAHPDAARGNDQVVLGGKRLTGFLVVPDRTERPVSVPALHVSEFIQLIDAAGLGPELGPLNDNFLARVPFALVFGIRLDDKGQAGVFVAPQQLLERRDVWAWRLKLDTGTPAEKQFAPRLVTNAEPIP